MNSFWLGGNTQASDVRAAQRPAELLAEKFDG